MKRGDVVRTFADYMALPDGADLLGINGVDWRKKGELDEESFDRLPALVRVVGPVEPEWLEAAARAGRTVDIAPNDDDWDRISEPHKGDYRKMARAAVAAADKARGIVNTREEFDALPAGTRVVDVVGDAYDSGSPYAPDEWPCVVVPKRIYT